MYASSKELARRVFNQLYPETFWEKLTRICSSRNRIVRTDHKGAHHTEYVLGLLSPSDGPIYLPIVCKTLSAMEVLNEKNPACWTCEPKKRGLIHVVEKP